MAGSKPKAASSDDSSKKRKRDANEAAQRAKRARSGAKDADTNGEKLSELDLVEDKFPGVSEEKLATLSEDQKALLKQTTDTSGWRVSKPMGGRMMDIDPILTDSDQYVIVLSMFYETQLTIVDT